MFSKACEYGIRAVIFIAGQPDGVRRARLRDIAKGIDAPAAFTGKVLQQLARNKIIQTVKGPSGGFEMIVQPGNSLKLKVIVDTLDGKDKYSGCGLGLPDCDATRPCPLHCKYEQIRDEIMVMLENTTIEDLAAGLQTGATWLKREKK